MAETVHRRTQEFSAQLRRRRKILLLAGVPACVLFVLAVEQIRHPDWAGNAEVFGITFLVAEAIAVLTLWTTHRLHLDVTELELILDDERLTVRRPGFLETIRYRDIDAVRGRTDVSGAMKQVEVFRGRKISRLAGFDRMQEIYDHLAVAAGGRALVVTGAPRHVYARGLALGIVVALFLAVFVIRKLWWGWPFPAELAYQLLPAGFGSWLLGGRPLTAGGLVAKRRFEVVLGVLLIVTGLGQALIAWQQKPLERTLVVEGRVIRSPQLGLKFEFSAPWRLIPIDASMPVPPGFSPNVTKMAEGAFILLRNDERGCGLMLFVAKSETDRGDVDGSFRAFEGNPSKVRVSQVAEANLAGMLMHTAILNLNEPPIVATSRMSFGQRNRYILWTVCLVPPGHDASLAECDRLLEHAEWAN